jgi:hypothetical protein
MFISPYLLKHLLDSGPGYIFPRCGLDELILCSLILPMGNLIHGFLLMKTPETTEVFRGENTRF